MNKVNFKNRPVNKGKLNSKVLSTINKIWFSNKERIGLVNIVDKQLSNITSKYEPCENKNNYLEKFYDCKDVFHTEESLQDNDTIIPIWYVNNGSDDFIDIFYNKKESIYECLWSTSIYFEVYKEILKLNNVVSNYIPENTKLNTKEVFNNLTVWIYITEQSYNKISNIVEKFSHNIQEDDQYWTAKEYPKKMMFEVWENWEDWGMTRDLEIVIEKWKIKETYFINYINNSAPLGKQIKYEDPNWWHDYPYIKIWENLELSNESNEIKTRENYDWDKKKDMSKLKDFQKVNIINSLDFKVYKDNWEYKLEDIQRWNIGNIEDGRFISLDDIIERLDTYIYDYYLRDVE